MSHNNYPNKPAFHTECSGGEWEGDDTAGFAGAMSLVVNAPREWAKAVVRWNMALDGSNGPTNGGCLTCRGVLTVAQGADGQWDYTKTVDYYALGHASKFVRPGAHRIASNTLGAGGVQDVAYVNPDGSKALVAYNAGTSRATFRVQWGERWFAYALNAGAAATFTWKGHQRGAVDDGDDRVGRPGVQERRRHPPRRELRHRSAGLPGPGTRGRRVARILRPHRRGAAAARRGDAAAAYGLDRLRVGEQPRGPARPGDRWRRGDALGSGGAGMAPGDWFQVDLGAKTAFSEVVLDTSASAGDFVRGYEVYVSDDGTNWGEPIARGGGRTLLRVLVPPVEARYVRVVNTGSSGSWWSIHELNVLAGDAPAADANASAAGSSRDGLGALQRRTATLFDGTELEVVYNAGRSVATFGVTWAGTEYTYTLPAGAAAAFTTQE